MTFSLQTDTPTAFGATLRRLRTKYAGGMYSFSKGVCDPSYLSRCESGSRRPPQEHIVDALASKLGCTQQEWDELRVAAGYRPRTVDELGWSPALHAAALVLNNTDLSDDSKREFERTVLALAEHWG